MSGFDIDNCAAPLGGGWEQCQYTLPSPPPSELSSPALSVAMLRSRLTPDHDVCMPTSQVFDMNESTPPTPSAATDSEQSPAPVVKKSRPTTKDFVPPDVSGLSKREARLVKNRAAAFLSRQRKREEFESMEVRVAQLEQENARLLAMTNSASSDPNQFYHSEIENLRSQLAAAQAREMHLNSQLALQSRAPSPVKLEPEEPPLSSSATLKSLASQLPNKSGASFGLMVLLCALPSLLSVQTQASMPTTFTIPNPLPTSSNSLDFSSFMPADFDWNHSGSHEHTVSFAPTTQKLEFMDADWAAGLAGLDVSFDTSAMPDGKIRVKIHHPATAQSGSSDPSPVASPGWLEGAAATSSSDPFFGLGPHYAVDGSSGASPRAYSPSIAGDLNYDLNYELGSDYGFGTHQGVRRRVRIALKSMPVSGGEGGEWEVQLC